MYITDVLLIFSLYVFDYRIDGQCSGSGEKNGGLRLASLDLTWKSLP